MTTTVKARKVGGAAGVTIPRGMRERFKIEIGDTLTLVETDRGILVTPYDPDFDEAMKAASSVMRQYRNTMKGLSNK